MSKNVYHPLMGRPNNHMVTSITLQVMLLTWCGCQESVSKNESVSLWPAFNNDKTFVIDELGTHHLSDTGSAFLIAKWDKSAKIDKLGNVIFRREDVTLWPFFEVHEKVDQTSKHSRGTILLLFRYDTLMTVGDSRDMAEY